MSKDPIMQRMKENYESRSRSYLLRRTPVVIRIDGKAFHTYTKGLNKPFDECLIEDMQETTKFLCENIQGAVLGYCQSDEISILLVDYKKLTSDAWFDYEIQKICSVAASLATGIFNSLRVARKFNGMVTEPNQIGEGENLILDLELPTIANFDARAFNIPKEEVANYFLARQKDAVKNSISMLAQSLYSHKELEGVDSAGKQELCFQKGVNWNNLHFSKKHGTTFIKAEKTVVNLNTQERYLRSTWKIDESQFQFDDEYFKHIVWITNT